MAIRNWTWWRLYTKIQPLLDVHRTEEELRSKDVSVALSLLDYEARSEVNDKNNFLTFSVQYPITKSELWEMFV